MIDEAKHLQRVEKAQQHQSIQTPLFPCCVKERLSCDMEGLRSEQIPSAAADSSSAAASPRYKRCFICQKCNRNCRLFTSSTLKNPGRQFYKCAFDHATFFKWADEVQSHEFIEVPYCGGCAAGICRVKRMTSGPNKDRIMFMCRVKEGEGSCGYRVWQDELQKSEEMLNLFPARMADCNETSGTVTDMLEDNKKTDEGHVSPFIEPSDDVPCREVTSQMINHEEILKPPFLNEPETVSRVTCGEDKSNITPKRPHKRSHYGDIIASSLPISDRFLAVCFTLNSVSTRQCWMTDAIPQNLRTELNGWWGRLVFHPMRCLMLWALEPSISSSVLYPLESICVVQNISLHSSGSITSTRDSWGVESYSKLSFNPKQHDNTLDSNYLVNSIDATTLASSHLLGKESHRRPLVTHVQRHNTQITSLISFNESSHGYPPSKTGTHSIMSKSISNIFNIAAECLQNELLTHLETMDVKDHKAMSQAAEDTFTALDCLLFDHEDLKKRANELIHCASSLVDIKQSMPEKVSHQKLSDCCSNERVRLDEIKSEHDKAVEAVTKNKKHLKVMQEEISSTMDWLFHVEAEVSCCEVEMKQLELELEKLAKDKQVLEVKYMIASKEVEESRKLLEQKEAEHNAAKAAYERARALLRG